MDSFGSGVGQTQAVASCDVMLDPAALAVMDPEEGPTADQDLLDVDLTTTRSEGGSGGKLSCNCQLLLMLGGSTKV